jgi:hypothetical protein
MLEEALPGILAFDKLMRVREETGREELGCAETKNPKVRFIALV